MQLTEADLLAVERELCRRSLADFAKRAWVVLEPAAKLKWGWALDAICLHLEAVTEGRITRLLMNVPPGSMKSLLTGVIWPAWEWGPRGMPEMRFVGTAHEEQLAIRDSRRCRDLIKSEWYQRLWPVQLSADLDGKREFGNTRKGVRQARAFTSMTGVRGDRVILDDPISADNANSEAKLEAARIAFTETLPTRVNSDKSAIVVIMQRLNERDTSGVIKDMGLPYVHLCIPMRFDPTRKCSTSIGWEDPRTEEGELMFPERFSEEQVCELEKTLGSYGTAGQLQQNPSPRGGGILKTAWFRYWTTAVPPLEWTEVFVDTAQKDGEENDYCVLQLWGRSTAGQGVLLDQRREKWEAPDLVTNARAFWNKHKASAFNPRRMGVEDKVSGTGLIQTLRREGIPILGIPRDKDKVSRGHDAAPFIESGNVLLPADAPWLSDFLAEAEKFPNGAHDDQMDPMFDAIDAVQRRPSEKPATANPVPTVSHFARRVR
ncbi:MAG TPA: phage terminase large subunit [Ramlibacter sp.]|uniref:phage terminase large subunit n=1 Tax=Ramlibacter sp. TaxID=1917967 RepID=UPI002D7F5ED2|nr:phage terminase large subunit [Ramlibacter sp.]HET8744303.1 phage terminase large subunit [Ramlibacter sp.]